MTLFFKGNKLLSVNFKGWLPHPIVREKSFPVPIGKHPNFIQVIFNYSLTHYYIPQNMEPSPPHIIILISMFFYLFCKFFIDLSYYYFFYKLNRSINFTVIVLFYLY
jgi:hypothetical protein